MEYVPLRVSRLFGEPGRKAFGLSLILENRPGVLAEVASALGNMRLNIIGLEVSLTKPTSDAAHVFVAVDATGAKLSTDEVVATLRSLSSVRTAEVVEPAWHEYLVANEKHFPLLIDDERAVLFPASLARSIVMVTKEKLGAPVSGAVRWMQGVGLGEELFRQFTERGASSVEDFAKLLALYLRALGWCIVRHVEVGEGYVKFQVERCWECEAGTPSAAAEGHMMRGILQGLFTGTFGGIVRVEETRCIAKGNDFCEFEARRVESKRT